MEITTFNGDSPVDERFNNLFYMHVVIAVYEYIYLDYPRGSII